MAGLEYSARISSESLSRLYQDAREAPGVIQVELRRGVKDAGQDVVKAVQAKAATFSKQIPAKIKLKVSFAARGGQVKVIADDPSGEAAALNNRNKGGTFRHPVFAHPEGRRDVRAHNRAWRFFHGAGRLTAHDWRWVPQVAHPFFVSAAHPAALQAADKIRAVMDDIARKLGF